MLTALYAFLAALSILLAFLSDTTLGLVANIVGAACWVLCFILRVTR